MNDNMRRESYKAIERAKKIGAMSMADQRAYLESEKRREPESDSADCAPRTGSAAACLTCIHWNRFEWQTPHGYGKCCVHQINTRASYECADYQKPKPPNEKAHV